MTELHLKCKGCGDIDSIVDVDLVPRSQGFTIGEDIEDKNYDSGHDEAAWEAALTVGQGCLNDSCKYVHYDYGYPEWDEKQGYWIVRPAPKIEDIADVVVFDEMTGEYVAPTVGLGL